MARAKLTDSAHLSFTQMPDSMEKKELPTLGQFRVRTILTESKKELVLLEHLCPYLTGCRMDSPMNQFKFLEPYGYCYYVRAYEFANGADEVERRAPVLMPGPIREPAGEFEAFSTIQ